MMMSAPPISKRSELELLRSQLEQERSSFISHWRDLADHVKPRRPRFTLSDVNRGDRRNQKIIDSTATRALRTLTAGMMGGITSPARPWFRLSTPDPELAEFEPVKEYLHAVTRRMNTVFLRSNLYKVLPSVYSDLGLFGTACQFIEEDFDTVIHNYSIPIGSYCIANDEKLRVRVFEREFRMTVRQLVNAFGRTNKNGKADWANFSMRVKSAYDAGRYEEWVDVVHIIRPNRQHMPNSPLPQHKKFYSCYYEKGQGGTSYTHPVDEILLRESGYDLFPVLAPRWEVTGEDVYGTSCPGIDTLGDIRALQLMQRRKAQMVEKFVNPPMQADANMKSQRVSILPGDINYVASATQQNGLRPVHEIDPRIQELLLDIQDTRLTIKEGFFETIFLMMAETDRRQITATEVDERKQEKLLVLGPVLEQLNQDLLDPLVDNTYHYMQRQGLLPPPPPDIQGQELKVEYISIMAAAQKLLGVASQDRFMSGVLQLASVDQRVLHKVDTFQWVDDQADMLGINPKTVRTSEEANAIMQQSMQAAQQQQAVETAAAGASAAKDLAQTPMDTDSALSRLLGT